METKETRSVSSVLWLQVGEGMADYSNVKEQILKVAGEQFFRVGYSQVTTDDLAVQLGISKKTLYKYFPNKKELLREVIKKMIDQIASQVETLISNEPDFIMKLKKMMTVLGIQTSQIGTAIVQDFQKNTPDIWEELLEFREKKVINHFRNLLQEGIDQGLINQEINQEIILQMYLSSVRNIINPAVLPTLPLSFGEVHDTIIRVIFNGILVGRERL
ncbi:MAG TPA: TetR/AcrR family transcriptional regulator [Bacillota bacterium]|nr:TetR/AcrR family transcriptional regulator [Bacillota bacterium]